MGYMKSLLDLPMFQREEYLEGQCRKCGSWNVDYGKSIHCGKIQGKTYHYWLKCNSCGAHYNVKRTKFVFEKVKDKDWKLSKKLKQNDYQQRLP